jgi:hypothetical protein
MLSELGYNAGNPSFHGVLLSEEENREVARKL